MLSSINPIVQATVVTFRLVCLKNGLDIISGLLLYMVHDRLGWWWYQTPTNPPYSHLRTKREKHQHLINLWSGFPKSKIVYLLRYACKHCRVHGARMSKHSHLVQSREKWQEKTPKKGRQQSFIPGRAAKQRGFQRMGSPKAASKSGWGAALTNQFGLVLRFVMLPCC